MGDQHFTPPGVVDRLVIACVRRARDRVLDAGCGDGAFLLGALRRKRELDPDCLPERLAGDLLAVERDARLAGRVAADPALRGVRLLRRDFFDVPPEPVDAVVGNPPYTRNEELTDRAGPRRVLQAYPGLRLSRRSPLYVYFLLQAARFLRPGGRLGLVLPSAWLACDYGADLQAWLLQHFRDIEVAEAEDEAWFASASVNACLLTAVKRRGDDPLRFTRLRRGGGERTEVVGRGSLRAPWSIHLRAPDVYLRLLRRGGLVPLAELAEVRFAVKTGANAFFCLRPEAAAGHGIAPRYLRPLIYSLKDAPAIRVRQARSVLFCCADGGAADYIRHGEAAGYHRRPTCAARRPWYDLGRREPWPLLYPERSGERFLVLYNAAGAMVNKNLYELRPRDPHLTLPLCALLNSTWARLGNELHGRVLIGNQDVIDIDVGAVGLIPVPDLRRAGGEALRGLEAALRSIWDRPAPDLRRLDAATLALFVDGPPPVAELQAATRQLVQARQGKRLGADAASRARGILPSEVIAGDGQGAGLP